jgi:hypothetical protein
MKPFRSTKAIFLGVAGAVALFGFLGYAVLMPYLVAPYGNEAPGVRVPNIQNAPERSAPVTIERLDLPEGESPKK